MNSLTITIGERIIGARQPVYIIAELSANHGRDFDKALQVIRAAKEAGADAIKLQTYTPDTLTIDSRRPEFMIGKGSLWAGRNLYDLYAEAFTPWEWQPKLKVAAEELGLHCFSTPFDGTAVKFLEEMKVPAHKIASFELVDAGLLRAVAATGKPIIMSTGMASLGEIDEAVRTLREAGCRQLALLKCTSAYPSLPADMNLRTIPHLAEAFGVPAGISDHSMGVAVAVAAAAVGASIIEKHLTLSRSDPGPDSAFSLEPAEFREMVASVRTAEVALGRVSYDVTESEHSSRAFRRSLFAIEDIAEGEGFSRANVRSIRPAHGLHPRHFEEVLQRIAACDIKRGTPIEWELTRVKRTVL